MLSKMFFNGGVQSGVAKALEEQRSVVCFVSNNDPESREWEESFMQDEEVRNDLESRAVVLRVPFPSQEADFLSAYCPITNAPALVIINNAILCAHIRVGTTREQFRTQVTDALAPRSRSESSLLATTKSRGEGAVSESEPCASSSQHESTGSSTDPMTLTPSAQTVLEERRKRLAADEVAKTAQQKLDRNGRTDAPRQEDQEASLGFSNPELLAHMQEQQRRLADAKQERRRILRAIEYDRQQRRERTEMRRALAASNTDVDGTAPPRRTVATTNASSECTVKVRLFDGRTITSHFDPMQTLRSHVRPWIDCNRNDDGIPFNFRQIHTPLSNRLITISEEDQPLEATGLCPGANLIMVPVQNFTTAYKQVPTSLYKSLSYSYNVIADRVGRLSALLGSVTGPFLSSGPNTASEANTSVNRVTSSPRKNSSTEDEQDEQQLYNGNQLNFIPRRDVYDDE